MKKHGTTILMILIFVLGLGLLLYPTVSDWWNSRNQSKAVASYSENVNSMKEEEKKIIFPKPEGLMKLSQKSRLSVSFGK